MATKRASFYADLDLLRSQFDSLDPKNSGYIGYSELTTLVKSMQGFEESMVPELMERLDRDKDGKVITASVFVSRLFTYGWVYLVCQRPLLEAGLVHALCKQQPEGKMLSWLHIFSVCVCVCRDKVLIDRGRYIDR